MTIPSASWWSASLTGASLAGLVTLLDFLNARGVVSENADGPHMFPAIAAYFLVTVLVWVIGIRNISPPELKTRIPFVYIPTNRAGVRLMLNVWGRMFAWFLGAGVTGLLIRVSG